MNGVRFLNILKCDSKLQEQVRNWRNKKAVRRFMLNQHFISKDEHFCWLKNLKKSKDKKFWVVYYQDISIGAVYLDQINQKKKSAQIGIYIGEDKYRGKEIGKIVLFNFLKLCFETTRVEILLAKVMKANIVAQKLYQNFFFKPVGAIRMERNKKILLFKLTKKRWLNSQDWLKDVFENQDNFKS